MSMDALQQLTAAADAIVASPLALSDEAAQEFLEAHPLDTIFRCVFISDRPLNGSPTDLEAPSRDPFSGR